MSKTVVLLDTNFSAKPIYDYLVETGADVFVVGRNPRDTLARSVKNYIDLDYSNVAKVKSLVKQLNADFLVPGGNDLSYIICSQVCSDFEFYNIDSLEVTETLNDKEKFRRLSTKIGIHVPRIVERDEIDRFLPVIVKPVDAYSGHGMTLLHAASQKIVDSAIDHAKKNSRTSTYIIEQFVDGQLFSHSAFIVKGELLIDFIVEEHCVVNRYVVDTSRVRFDFDDRIRNQLRNDILILTKRLNLVDGLIHTQFIYDGRSFWIIEVTRRCPGDLYSLLIEYSTNFPYAEYYARPFLQNACTCSDLALKQSSVIRHTVTVDKTTAFNSLSFRSPVQLIKFLPLASSGDQLRESPFSRMGLLFIKNESESDFRADYQAILDRRLYEIL